MTPRARAAGAAGAADAVRVGLLVLGRVEVDDVRDVVEVEPAGGDVGRDQRRDLAGLEARRAPSRAAPASCRRASRRRVTLVLRRGAAASRSAPRLVRTKTSASPRSACEQLDERRRPCSRA